MIRLITTDRVTLYIRNPTPIKKYTVNLKTPLFTLYISISAPAPKIRQNIRSDKNKEIYSSAENSFFALAVCASLATKTSERNISYITPQAIPESKEKSSSGSISSLYIFIYLPFEKKPFFLWEISSI